MATKPMYDSPEAFAEQMEARYLHCRELGHSWADYVASYDTRTKVYDRTLICSSCGTERPQVLDQDGYLIKSGGYKYPPGYLAPRHLASDQPGGRINRAVFRKASLERVTGGGRVTTIKRRKKATG